MSFFESQPSPDWVYSFSDYRQMFDLKDSDLEFAILDFASGLSSFNAEMYQDGHTIVSGDSHYVLSSKEMYDYSQQILQANVDFLKSHDNILQHPGDLEKILDSWIERRDIFLKDYGRGKEQGRYLTMDLPKLPYDDQVFDMALCADHLFRDIENAQESLIINELCRVAKEVRVFPLQNAQGEVSSNLGHLMLELQKKGAGIEVRSVAFDQLQGGNAMLRIWSTQCLVDVKSE